MRATPSPRRELEITYKEKGAERPDAGAARSGAQIERGASPTAVRAVVRADRVNEIEMQIEPRDDREALRAADVLDELRPAARGGAVHGRAVVRPRRSPGDRPSCYEGRPRADAVPGTRRRPRRRTSRLGGAKPKGPIVAVRDHIIGPDESEAIDPEARGVSRRSRPTRSGTRTAGATFR